MILLVLLMIGGDLREVAVVTPLVTKLLTITYLLPTLLIIGTYPLFEYNPYWQVNVRGCGDETLAHCASIF